MIAAWLQSWVATAAHKWWRVGAGRYSGVLPADRVVDDEVGPHSVTIDKPQHTGHTLVHSVVSLALECQALSLLQFLSATIDLVDERGTLEAAMHGGSIAWHRRMDQSALPCG